MVAAAEVVEVAEAAEAALPQVGVPQVEVEAVLPREAPLPAA